VLGIGLAALVYRAFATAGFPSSRAEALRMARDGMALKRIDHVRMFVGNARQSAYFYRNAFGFDVIGYAGLETGVRHEACYVLRQGEITLVLASPLGADHPDAQRLVRHGDGVQSIALEVADVSAAFAQAVARGARPASPPRTLQDDFGTYHSAEIHAYGDTTHTLVDRSGYRGLFAPGFRPLDPDRYSPRTFHPVGLKAIDHIVANVEEGKMGDWVDYYSKIMGFSLLVSFDDKDISTDYSALMSKVVADGRGRIKFPINEPAKGRRRSQIDEFLDFYGGPGVQHVALSTGDIISSVRAMAANDVSFLKVPPAYYEMLPERAGPIKENLDELAELGILVDRDDEGYLLQIFTKPVEDRPTLFFEIIQRRGAKSFGKGNFKALFEAIEREQARRGTL
jgi:4-hydroxyphenylpyruvate dioxygenase